MTIRIYTRIKKGLRAGRFGWITWYNVTVNQAFYNSLNKHHFEWVYYQWALDGKMNFDDHDKVYNNARSANNL